MKVGVFFSLAFLVELRRDAKGDVPFLREGRITTMVHFGGLYEFFHRRFFPVTSDRIPLVKVHAFCRCCTGLSKEEHQRRNSAFYDSIIGDGRIFYEVLNF